MLASSTTDQRVVVRPKLRPKRRLLSVKSNCYFVKSLVPAQSMDAKSRPVQSSIAAPDNVNRGLSACTLVQYVVVGSAAFVCYLNTLSAGFVYDDRFVMVLPVAISETCRRLQLIFGLTRLSNAYGALAR